MSRRFTWFSVFALLILTHVARGHYLWLGFDPKAGDNGTVRLFFEEGPSAGDGQYLDPFVKGGTTWTRTVEEPKPAVLKLTDVKEKGKRWMQAALPVKAPCAIESYGLFGVYPYGKTNVLLHYNARHLDVRTPEQLAKLARPEHLALDIVPTLKGDEVEIQVLWKGKPAAGASVRIGGPGGLVKTTLADKEGRARFKPRRRGQHRAHATIDEKNKGGKHEGELYSVTRHHCTLTMTLPLQTK